MRALAEQIFSALRQMDAEAVTIRDGAPTGLSWYGAHSRPQLKKPQTEPAWSKRLAAMLTARGWPATCEVRYPNLPPGRSSRCDVIVTLSNGGRLWLEVKGAWKSWWMQRGGEWIYRAYLLHPLVPGLDPKSHTAALDLEKLKSIDLGDGSHIGLLLVGFDSTDAPMKLDVAEFIRLANLDSASWVAYKDAWPDSWRAGEHVRCWLWLRTVQCRDLAGSLH